MGSGHRKNAFFLQKNLKFPVLRGMFYATTHKNVLGKFMSRVLEIENFSPDRNSPVPLHLQLTEALRRQLRTLSVTENWLLPSERSLVASLKLDRSTVHRAYAELLVHDLVTRNPDKSLCVRHNVRKQLQGPFPLIGLILPVPFSEYVEQRGQRSFQYIKGIIDRAEELEISVVMLRLPRREASAAEVECFIRERCEVLSGLIHLGDRGQPDDWVFRKIISCRHFPQLFISGLSEFSHIGSVYTTAFPAADELIGRLSACRIRRAGILDFCKSEVDSGYHYVSFSRMKILRQALEVAGISVSDRDVWSIPAREGRQEAIRRLVRERGNDMPEFVWCVNDDVAESFVISLRSCGIQVPEDVSVAGYDGYVEFSRNKGNVASIAQPFYQMGVLAVNKIMEFFERGITEENRICKLPGIFIPGETIRS